MKKTIKQLLSCSEIDALDTQLLLAHALKRPREFVVAHPEYELRFFEYLKFKHCLKKRKKGLPLAHIIGHKEFFGLDFLVNKHTLVPRPDTEILVESVVEKVVSSIKYEVSSYDYVLIDVGTGSCCVPIAIIKALKHENIKTLKKENNLTMQQYNNITIKLLATDISKPALKIAKKNAKKHDVKINFLWGNLLEPIIHNSLFIIQSPIIITANLPYLTQEQFNSEPSIQKEPHSALVAEDNGLALYKKLLEQIKSSVPTGLAYRQAGRQAIFNLQSSINIFFEIDPTQSEILSKCILNTFPSAKIAIKKDLAMRDRVLCIELY